MKNTPLIPVTLRIPSNWGFIFTVMLIGVLLVSGLVLDQGQFYEFSALGRNDAKYFLKTILIYFFLFEFISIMLFMWAARYYAKLLKIKHIPSTIKGILLYELTFLPCILGSIVLFAPITNGLRYLVVAYPDYDWNTYFPHYFLQSKMYVSYLLPSLILGYTYLNTNLFLSYTELETKPSPLPPPPTEEATLMYANTIEAWYNQRHTILPVLDVIYFEVQHKTYFAYTKGRTFHIRKKLAELEAELNPQHFFRINRSIILNLHFLKSFTYWENDKYKVRLKEDKAEFVMQRTRVKVLKKILAQKDETSPYESSSNSPK